MSDEDEQPEDHACKWCGLVGHWPDVQACMGWSDEYCCRNILDCRNRRKGRTLGVAHG